MGTPVTRLIVVSRLTTCAACANAASTASLSPASESTQRLEALAGQSTGAADDSASLDVATAASGSQTSSICSPASIAWARVPATTRATGSPTYRTASI